MRLLFSVLLLLQLSVYGFTQGSSLKSKPSLDTSVLGKWPELHSGALSPNGKYLSYVLEEHIPQDQLATFLQTPDGKWKKELKGINGVKFTDDSRSAVYLNKDTLYRILLGTPQTIAIKDVLSYRLVSSSNGEWLVYQLRSPDKILIVQHERTKKQKRFTQVVNYTFSKDGETMVLESKSEDNKESQLKWINLIEEREYTIWKGSEKPQQVIFDYEAKQVAFITESNEKRSVWFCHKGSKYAEKVLDDSSIYSDLFVGNLDRFSKDGQRLFFYLERRYPVQQPRPNAANVNVWSYKDNMLQPQQLEEVKGRKEIVKPFLWVASLKDKRIIELQKRFSELIDQSEKYTLINQLDTDQDLDIGQGESDWNPARVNSQFYLVSNIDGSRIQLPWRFKEIYNPQFSPTGRFIIFRPYISLNYFTYEISTRITQNITTKIKTNLTLDICYKNAPIERQRLLDIPGWLKGDIGVLIYDHNDIWLLDPLAKKEPENITNGYGKTHGLIFRLGLQKYNNKSYFIQGQKLMLAAFNKKTKENGHYTTILAKKGDPLRIDMQLPIYSVGPSWGSTGGNADPIYPICAENANCYLIKRETVSDYPNYYFTRDLKTFLQITFLAPEKKFNWMTSELHSWVGPDGDTLQGVLYKPENFDPSRKYPVIFEVYRQFSDALNYYLFPKWSTDQINVPWFVSNGYLVFTPDIYYTAPSFKNSVVKCVTSAAKYVSKLPFVDGSRLGIQGHSVGGMEMGYIVTSTAEFAAVSSAAGSYDYISEIGTILPPPTSTPRPDPGSSSFFNGTLWDKNRKSLFLEHSVIFDVHKVQTPILMVAGEKDNIMPYDQSIEFFLGLRRLNKPAWMLTYPEEYHTIFFENNYKDYTFRMTQFFDHYLKGVPAPFWMTKGILARLKGTETGYELDFRGSCNEACKICNHSN